MKNIFSRYQMFMKYGIFFYHRGYFYDMALNYEIRNIAHWREYRLFKSTNNELQISF